MRNVRLPFVLVMCLAVVWAVTRPIGVAADKGRERIALEDDCDPADPAWGVNGCLREEGSVTREEFNQFSLITFPPPLAAAVIGHPAWRIGPGYLTIEAGEKLRVRNTGGRGHTFTEVPEYGGGFVGALNFGLTPAPRCTPATAPVIAPGDRTEIRGLAEGNHKFMCCIHPWMRTLVKVTADDDHHGK